MKQQQRLQIKQKIAAMADAQKVLASNTIAQKVIDSAEFLNAKKIFCYYSMPDEVDTFKIIAKAEELGKEIYLSLICDEEMHFARYAQGIVTPGRFGIMQPRKEYCLAQTPKFDLCICPMRGFDSEKNRLGRGKGFYDRFFAKNDCTKIGLAFSCQQLEGICTDVFDVKMDKIVTQYKIFN